MSDGDWELAAKVSGETPWWAKAPVWLAAGIVGVPSLIALGAGFFIVKGVSAKLQDNGAVASHAIATIEALNNELKLFHDQDLQQFLLIREYLAQMIRTEFRSCIHEAHNDKERDECLKTAKEDIEGLQNRK